MTSAIELTRAYAQALLVDREALAAFQSGERRAPGGADPQARVHDRRVPILARARVLKGATIDPIAAYRRSKYRDACADRRPASGSHAAESSDERENRMKMGLPLAVVLLSIAVAQPA